MELSRANSLLRIGARVFKIVAVPWTATRRALNRIETYLILAIGMYSWFWVRGPKPYCLGEIVLWFSSLPAELQAGTMAGLLTVLGFAIAFWSAHSNWIVQTKITLKLKAADEIYSFFQQTAKDMLTLRRSMELIVDVQQKVMLDKQALASELDVACDLLNRYHDEYAVSLDRLRRSLIEVEELRSKHILVLANLPLGIASFDNAKTTLLEMDEVHGLLPHPEKFDRNSLVQFAIGTQPNIYRQLLKKIEPGNYLILAGPGGLRGAAMGDLFKPSLASINETAGRIEALIDEGEPLGMLFRKVKK